MGGHFHSKKNLPSSGYKLKRFPSQATKREIWNILDYKRYRWSEKHPCDQILGICSSNWSEEEEKNSLMSHPSFYHKVLHLFLCFYFLCGDKKEGPKNGLIMTYSRGAPEAPKTEKYSGKRHCCVSSESGVGWWEMGIAVFGDGCFIVSNFINIRLSYLKKKVKILM